MVLNFFFNTSLLNFGYILLWVIYKYYVDIQWVKPQNTNFANFSKLIFKTKNNCK